MSTTYDIFCKECNIGLWIGQKSSTTEGTIYNTKDVYTNLKELLFSHIGHHLAFNKTPEDETYISIGENYK